jgi:hypothetical protein
LDDNAGTAQAITARKAISMPHGAFVQNQKLATRVKAVRRKGVNISDSVRR